MFALQFPPIFLFLRSALCGLKDIRQMAFYSHWSPGLRGSGNVTRTEEPLTAAEVSVLFSHPSFAAPTATKSTSTQACFPMRKTRLFSFSSPRPNKQHSRLLDNGVRQLQLVLTGASERGNRSGFFR